MRIAHPSAYPVRSPTDRRDVHARRTGSMFRSRHEPVGERGESARRAGPCPVARAAHMTPEQTATLLATSRAFMRAHDQGALAGEIGAALERIARPWKWTVGFIDDGRLRIVAHSGVSQEELATIRRLTRCRRVAGRPRDRRRRALERQGRSGARADRRVCRALRIRRPDRRRERRRRHLLRDVPRRARGSRTATATPSGSWRPRQAWRSSCSLHARPSSANGRTRPVTHSWPGCSCVSARAWRG